MVSGKGACNNNSPPRLVELDLRELLFQALMLALYKSKSSGHDTNTALLKLRRNDETAKHFTVFCFILVLVEVCAAFSHVSHVT